MKELKAEPWGVGELRLSHQRVLLRETMKMKERRPHKLGICVWLHWSEREESKKA